MSEQEQIVGKCPQCGEQLQVPAGLESFCCMYCGARLTREQLLAKPAAAEIPADEVQRCYQLALPRLAECVTKYPDYKRKIVRDQFEPAFAEYRLGCSPVFEQLDRGIPAGDGREQRIDEAAKRLLDDLEQSWQSRGKSGALEDGKIVIAIFLVPLVRSLKLSISEAFCVSLQRQWVERHPKSPFYLGDYETISTGFRKKLLGLCFITTAVCEEFGKPDDCAELTAFRGFRDNYLRQSPDGQALIDEYYNIAPGIVCCINACGDRRERYAAIRDTFLADCYRDIQAGNLDACKQRYVQMVRQLQKQYLS